MQTSDLKHALGWPTVPQAARALLESVKSQAVRQNKTAILQPLTVPAMQKRQNAEMRSALYCLGRSNTVIAATLVQGYGLARRAYGS